QRLLDSGTCPECKAFDAIGYGDVSAHLRGEISFAHLLERVQRHTRNYAKRQLTWFRKESGIEWLYGFGDEPGVLQQALEKIEGRRG
ncbi:MAG TPA: tRNA (adenosine(37)-N6)-dimethylallyltransferase MiaA, partial [Acidobacteriota bacterium]